MMCGNLSRFMGDSSTSREKVYGDEKTQRLQLGLLEIYQERVIVLLHQSRFFKQGGTT